MYSADADGRVHLKKYIFYFFIFGIHRSTAPIGARPRVRPLGSPPHASWSYEDLLSLPVPTSTKIYTICRSTCLFNDPPISIESNRIVSYLFLYWSIPYLCIVLCTGPDGIIPPMKMRRISPMFPPELWNVHEVTIAYIQTDYRVLLT